MHFFRYFVPFSAVHHRLGNRKDMWSAERLCFQNKQMKQVKGQLFEVHMEAGRYSGIDLRMFPRKSLSAEIRFPEHDKESNF